MTGMGQTCRRTAPVSRPALRGEEAPTACPLEESCPIQTALDDRGLYGIMLTPEST